jgi:IclR family transcriptional regulator, pca regulon regulatory protein
MSIDSDSPDFVTSLARGLSVVRAFGDQASSLSLPEVAQRTDLTRPTARRFLLTLAALGYVRTDGKRFWLAPKTLELGYAYLSSMNISDIVQASLQHVVEQLGESCAMAVLNEWEVLYIARVPPKHSMWLQVNVGTRQPLYCTSSGRVLLADMEASELAKYFAKVERPKLTEHTVTDEAALRGILDGVRASGYALIDQEVEVGLRAIAVPVRGQNGKTAASLSVGTHTGRVTRADMIERILPPLKDCAREIEELLIRSDSMIGR